MRRIKILAWLAALLLPLRALAETCTLPTGTYNWTAACTVSAGTITGCTCNASDADIWEIPQDAIVTIPGDATVTDLDVTMSSATAQIIVRAGGQLTLAAAGGLGVPGAGLLVEPLGIFRSQGRALTYGNATPAYSAAALAQSTVPTVNTALAAGEIIHCPGTSTSTLVEDCEANDTTPGSPAQIAICWPNADDATARRQGYQVTTGGQPGEGFYPEWIAAAAVGDVLVFWDPTGGLDPSRDVNAMYEILSINTTTDDVCLTMAIRQGPTSADATTEVSCHANALSCHVAERDVLEVTLSAAYVAGRRTLAVGTTAITADRQREGRYLDCPADIDADGTNEPVRQIIQITEIIDDAGGDSIRIMPGGFAHGIADATTCFITYGWDRGDTLSLFRPALIGDGNAGTDTDSPITCSRDATCEFDFTVLDHLGQQLWFTGTVVRNSWMRGNGAGVGHLLAERAGPLDRYQSTAPNAASGHGFSPIGRNTNVQLSDMVIRHAGDDPIVFNGFTVTGPSSVSGGDDSTVFPYAAILRRIRFEFFGCAGGSCNPIDTGTGGGGRGIEAHDLLFRAGEGEDVTSGTINHIMANSLISVGGITSISAKGPMVTWGGTGTGVVALSNVYDIGRVNAGTQSFYRPTALTDASIIESRATGSGGYLFSPPQSGYSGSDVSLYRVLSLDADAPGSDPIYLFQFSDPQIATRIRDLAIISPNRTGQSAARTVLRFDAFAAGTTRMDAERITIGFRPGEQNTWSLLISASGTDSVFASYYTLKQVLLAHHWSSTANQSTISIADAPDRAFLRGGFCFVNNDQDFSGLDAAMDPVTTWRERHLPFVAPQLGILQQTPQSPLANQCGARDVGAYDQWGLRVIHHNPYLHGDSWKTAAWGRR